MKISTSKLVLLSLIAANICAAAPVNYYFNDVYGAKLDVKESYSVNPDGDKVVPETNPDTNSLLVFNKPNTGTFVRASTYGGACSFYGISSTVGLEIHATQQIKLADDFDITSFSDNGYSATDANIKQFRVAVSLANFLDVGGDMNLSTSKYFSSRFTLMGVNPTLKIGGALNFIYTGESTAAGFHAFDMSDQTASSTGTKFTINSGGLSSSGRAVYMTSAHSISTDYIFDNNASGVFKGGDFEGVFATESSVSTTANFTMNGNGKQSITVYKAANTAGHGISALASKKDMTIDKISVTAGEFVFNSELAANSLIIDGGSIEYVSAEKVSAFTINGGSLVYGGEIKAGDFTVAAVDIVKVILSAEDFAEGSATILSYDTIDMTEDANDIFAAYDASGNKLGGTFSVTNIEGAGSLLYTVPEPATLAAIFGAVALAFAAYRRRR